MAGQNGRTVVAYTQPNMGWKYDPPSPDTEATNMLSAYQERLRGAELRDRLEVNRGTEPFAVSRFNLERLRNAVVGIFTKVARNRQKSDRDSAP
jgi:hypothetical protein